MTRPALRYLALALVLVARVSPAQEHAKAPAKADSAPAAQAQPGTPAAEGKKDYIMPHILNGDHIAVPSTGHGLEREIHLPKVAWLQFHIGPVAIDLSPTKHVVMLLLASSILTLVMFFAGREATRARAEGRPTRGLGGAIEAMVLYLRNDILLPNLGHHGEKFVPFCLTVFFLILSCNLLGLFPYMATATGNISVTATLAILSFIMIETAGMKALGKGYINTILYWPHDLPLGIRIPISAIMTPVELLGKLTKPFALAMRLFANMTAGHIAVLALISLVFVFAKMISSSALATVVGILPTLLATAIMGLEVFVSFLQAFIFMLLTAVFIGQIRESHH